MSAEAPSFVTEECEKQLQVTGRVVVVVVVVVSIAVPNGCNGLFHIFMFAHSFINWFRSN